MALDQKGLQALSQRRHPDYDELLPHWEFLNACYIGGRAWFRDNIFRYMKEGDGEYTARTARAYRFNHTREVVDLINKYLFRAPIHRNVDDAPVAVQQFWKRATLQGLDIKEFMRVVSTKSSIMGRPWVIVDSQVSSVSETTSQADVEETVIYAYAVPVWDVLDMSYDNLGNLNWILVREYVRDDEDPFEGDTKVSEQYRLWGRTDWMLFTVHQTGSDASTLRAEVKDAGVHGLGVVPAVKVDNTVTDDQWSSPALITDIAYLDRAVANYASNLDAIIQDQTFSQLAMPAQNVLPGDDAYNAILDMGTKRIFLYDGESGKGPEFLSPDPRQAALISSAISQIISEIYHSVGLAGERTKEDNSKGIDNSSGVAKAMDFERVTALLCSKADSLETAENKIARLVALWAGEAMPEEDLITYADTFDVRGLSDELDIAMQLSLIDVPEIVRSEQMRHLVDKLFPGIGEDMKAKLKEAVDDWAESLQEKAELAMEAAQTANDQGSALLEEAKRNRSASGTKQSATKSRETGDK